eukprot:Ihof_evm8s197 gene=Ihof_evmTU8s197
MAKIGIPAARGKKLDKGKHALKNKLLLKKRRRDEELLEQHETSSESTPGSKRLRSDDSQSSKKSVSFGFPLEQSPYRGGSLLTAGSYAGQEIEPVVPQSILKTAQKIKKPKAVRYYYTENGEDEAGEAVAQVRTAISTRKSKMGREGKDTEHDRSAVGDTEGGQGEKRWMQRTAEKERLQESQLSKRTIAGKEKEKEKEEGQEKEKEKENQGVTQEIGSNIAVTTRGPLPDINRDILPFDLLSSELLDVSSTPTLFEKNEREAAIFRNWVVTRMPNATLDKPNNYQTSIKEQRTRLDMVNRMIVTERDNLQEENERLRSQISDGSSDSKRVEGLEKQIKKMEKEKETALKEAKIREAELQKQVTKGIDELKNTEKEKADAMKLLEKELEETGKECRKKQEEMERKEKEWKEREFDLVEEIAAIDKEREDEKTKAEKITTQSQQKASKEIEKERKAIVKEREKWAKLKEKWEEENEKTKKAWEKEKEALMNEMKKQQKVLNEKMKVQENAVKKLSSESESNNKKWEEEKKTLIKERDIWKKEEKNLRRQVEKAKGIEDKIGQQLAKKDNEEKQLRKKLVKLEEEITKIQREVDRKAREQDRLHKQLVEKDERCRTKDGQVMSLKKNTERMRRDAIEWKQCVLETEQDMEAAQHWALSEQERLVKMRESYDILRRMGSLVVARESSTVFGCTYTGLGA